MVYAIRKKWGGCEVKNAAMSIGLVLLLSLLVGAETRLIDIKISGKADDSSFAGVSPARTDSKAASSSGGSNSNTQVSIANTCNDTFWNRVPLTDSEIKVRWPNLPTAEELWNSSFRAFIDTSCIGEQNQTGLHIGDMTIENYTSNEPNFFSGLPDIFYSVPHIWLQYNSTIWVAVLTTLLLEG